MGDPNYPTFNGLEVIVSTLTLSAFATYMNSKQIPFTYDTAAGMFSKDMWTPDTTQTPAVRSGIAGIAYITGVCGTSRYMVQEEFGGFQSIGVTTHEIGHT